MRTQVAIIGAGPAGLLLARLLHLDGIESVVLESRTREQIEGTIRAGVLEQGTVDLLIASGVGDRLKREGSVHRGIEIAFDGLRHRIDFESLTAGRTITVYPQHEVIKDLVLSRMQSGGTILFGASNVRARAAESASPIVEFELSGQRAHVACDFIAGCDGFNGVSRSAVPEGVGSQFVRAYPFGWLGILCEAPCVAKELIYAYHDRGFALVSTRSPRVQRMYLQCDPADEVALWPDERIWEEFHARMPMADGWKVHEGSIFQKGIIAMRSFVVEPMQHGRLFLAGDAAHIVPPTGAKGLNLAVADVHRLARAFADYYARGESTGLERYSAGALQRVWQAEHFSWWMTSMLHAHGDAFDRRMQRAQLARLVNSRAARAALAESYVGG